MIKIDQSNRNIERNLIQIKLSAYIGLTYIEPLLALLFLILEYKTVYKLYHNIKARLSK